MSLRSKTQKAKKFGTPTTPAISTPKAPSPKAPKIVRTATPTVTTGAPRTKPTTTRGVLTQQEAGQIAQETFRTQVQSLTAPLRILRKHTYDLTYGKNVSPSAKLSGIEKLARIDEEIAQIETEQHNIVLQNNVNQIIQALESGNVIAPDYFQNNIAWVKTGAITQQAFLDSYYYLSNQGIIHTAPIIEPEIIFEEPIIEEPIEEPIIEIPELLPEVSAEPDSSITDNMVTQQVINFNIVNGRAVGSIKFVATNNFNPFWYGKNIVNIIQFKDPNGANILTYVKENRLNFTETERDEVISYDEDMKGNTRATVESFVWSSATTPTPFSKKFMVEIFEGGDPPIPKTTGFMSAGVAGAIAGLILIGFIADHKRGK